MFSRKQDLTFGVLSPMMPQSPPNQLECVTMYSPMQENKVIDPTDYLETDYLETDESTDDTASTPPSEAFTTPLQDSIDLYKARDEKYLRGINKVNEPSKKSKGGFKSKFKKMLAKLRKTASFKVKTRKEITVHYTETTTTTKIEQVIVEDEDDMEEDDDDDGIDTPIYSRNFSQEEIEEIFMPEYGTFAYELMKLCDEKFFGRH